MAALSAWGTSIACQRRRKAILPVRSRDGNLPRQDCHPAGGMPFWGATARYAGSLYRFWASLGILYTGLGAVVYRSPAWPAPLVGAPRGAQPATPPDQIEGADATRGPGRPKRLVVVAQGHRGRPAAGSRRRTPSYKFTSTKLCTLSPPTSSAAREPGEATTCVPSVAHRLGATRRPSGECSART